jgi:hypothetical protein
MSYGLVFFVGLTIGVTAGFIVTAFLTTSSNYDELVDAYNEGFIDGKKTADNMNNISDNEHNDIRC